MSSVNYDPIKAHEYYEKHKKLKGRSRSTKGWNQSQKEQWAYAKAQLAEQKKAQNAELTEQKSERSKAISEAKKKQKEMLTKQAKAKIDALRNRLKNLSGKQKYMALNAINGAIESLKSGLADKKTAIDEKAKKDKEKLSAETKSAKEKVKENYEKGLDDAHKKIGG